MPFSREIPVSAFYKSSSFRSVRRRALREFLDSLRKGASNFQTICSRFGCDKKHIDTRYKGSSLLSADIITHKEGIVGTCSTWKCNGFGRKGFTSKDMFRLNRDTNNEDGFQNGSQDAIEPGLVDHSTKISENELISATQTNQSTQMIAGELIGTMAADQSTHSYKGEVMQAVDHSTQANAKVLLQAMPSNEARQAHEEVMTQTVPSKQPTEDHDHKVIIAHEDDESHRDIHLDGTVGTMKASPNSHILERDPVTTEQNEITHTVWQKTTEQLQADVAMFSIQKQVRHRTHSHSFLANNIIIPRKQTREPGEIVLSRQEQVHPRTHSYSSAIHNTHLPRGETTELRESIVSTQEQVHPRILSQLASTSRTNIEGREITEQGEVVVQQQVHRRLQFITPCGGEITEPDNVFAQEHEYRRTHSHISSTDILNHSRRREGVVSSQYEVHSGIYSRISRRRTPEPGEIVVSTQERVHRMTHSQSSCTHGATNPRRVCKRHRKGRISIKE
ncbi:hypothetical protein SK128_000392, partial [Halocaridina rubra]